MVGNAMADQAARKDERCATVKTYAGFLVDWYGFISFVGELGVGVSGLWVFRP